MFVHLPRRAGAAVCRIGVDPAAIVFGVAYADRSSDLKAAIMALRFPKIPTAKLVDIRVKEGGSTTTDLPTTPRLVGSRP